MPISGFFRPPAVDGARHAGGYTLLEIIVVMALIGLLTGIAVPRMAAVYEGVLWASERDEVLRGIAGLGLDAFREARELTLVRYPGEGMEKLPFDLPEGWLIEAEEPVRYSSEGVCSGGRVRLSKDDRMIVLELVPPLCLPRIQ